MEFTSNPNQRRITYHKIEGTTGYTKINIDASRQAMNTLSYSAFMLYSYMALNADNYEDWFSPAILIQKTNLTESTYRKAFSELVEKGYLVQDEHWKSHYTFYEGKISDGSERKNLSKKTKARKTEPLLPKSKLDVSKNDTDNIVNIAEPPAPEERSARDEKISTYFLDFLIAEE